MIPQESVIEQAAPSQQEAVRRGINASCAQYVLEPPKRDPPPDHHPGIRLFGSHGKAGSSSSPARKASNSFFSMFPRRASCARLSRQNAKRNGEKDSRSGQWRRSADKCSSKLSNWRYSELRRSKMISGISNVTQPQPVAQSTEKSTQKPAQSQPQVSTRGDSVQLSKAAQTMLAAQQEAIETPAQTATEAGHGDLQALKLLAKEAAARSVAK